MPAITCPYCGVRANVTKIHFWDGFAFSGGSRVKQPYGTWTCDNCGRPIVGERSAGDPHNWHPKRIIEPGFPDVPTSIARDAREAHKCHSIEAYRAAVAMARRALQAAVYDLADRNDKEAPDSSLYKQIEWLADEGLVTDTLKSMATRIRLSGNIGAHPDKDGLEDIGKQDSKAALEFLEDLLHFTYVVPARLERATTETSDEEGSTPGGSADQGAR